MLKALSRWYSAGQMIVQAQTFALEAHSDVEGVPFLYNNREYEMYAYMEPDEFELEIYPTIYPIKESGDQQAYILWRFKDEKNPYLVSFYDANKGRGKTRKRFSDYQEAFDYSLKTLDKTLSNQGLE